VFLIGNPDACYQGRVESDRERAVATERAAFNFLPAVAVESHCE